MEKKNKFKYQIAAIKRNNLMHSKSKAKCFDFVVCINSKHNKKFVIEKLGSLNGDSFYINNFRFVYWLQFGVSFNIKAWIIFKKYIVVLNKIGIDKGF